MKNKAVLNIFHIITAGFVALVVINSLSCGSREGTRKLDLTRREPITEKNNIARKDAIRIAVGGMITPKDGFIYYKAFVDYMGRKMGRPVQFVDREKYDEINALLKAGEIDAAFVCSGPYVDGHAEFGMELLAAPQAHGGTVYYSYIVVAKDSPITDFEGLRGKRFAFTDPISNTGTLVPAYMLAKMHETPATFFKEYVYTYAHDKSIRAVALKLVEGAAVDSLIWDYLDRTNPEFTSKTRIIIKSPPYGIPPFAVRKDLSPELKKAMQQALLNAYKDAEGKELLREMMIERFVIIPDSAYDSVREMKAWLARHGAETKGQ